VVWLIVVTSLNVATQFRLPDWIRARGLATYQIAFQGCLALGGLIWGVLADAAGVEGAHAVASAAVLLGTLGGTRWSLASGEALDLHPTALWPAPNVARAPEPEEGPVLVQVTYRIDPAQANAFSRAVANLGRLRRRDGASRWLLFEDVAEPGRYVESFLVESWAEHLRQDARATEADRQVEERVLGYQTADVPVEARHLVAREGD